jgi:hypothetical protein
VPKPYAHPHQWQADALLGSLLAGGAAALLLATILVANMLNGLFTQQIPQIGIMKAIGAGSGRIGQLYMAMTLLVAAAATLLALGPAIRLSRVGVGQFTSFLGIQAAALAAPRWTYAVVLAVGLWPAAAAGPCAAGQGQPHHCTGGDRPPRRSLQPGRGDQRPRHRGRSDPCLAPHRPRSPGLPMTSPGDQTHMPAEEPVMSRLQTPGSCSAPWAQNAGRDPHRQMLSSTTR